MEIPFYLLTDITLTEDVGELDYVDFAASGALLGAGFLVSNPVGWGILIGAGVTYGVYRIAAGDEADAWINENFGFK